MAWYTINQTARRLHLQGCPYIREAVISGENKSLPELLAEYHKPLKCCELCLRNDGQAHELVKQHNEQIVWPYKKKDTSKKSP